jgi:hypothetical protein
VSTHAPRIHTYRPTPPPSQFTSSSSLHTHIDERTRVGLAVGVRDKGGCAQGAEQEDQGLERRRHLDLGS